MVRKTHPCISLDALISQVECIPCTKKLDSIETHCEEPLKKAINY